MFHEPPIVLLFYAAGFFTGLYFRETVEWLLHKIIRS